MNQSEFIKKLIKTGQSERAQKILAGILKSDPNNAEAWWLLSFAIHEPDRQIYALKRVLRIHPRSKAAARRLQEFHHGSALLDFVDAPEKAPSLLIKRQRSSSRNVLASRSGRIWVGAIASLFVVTLSVALILNNALHVDTQAPQFVGESQELAALDNPTEAISTMDIAQATLPATDIPATEEQNQEAFQTPTEEGEAEILIPAQQDGAEADPEEIPSLQISSEPLPESNTQRARPVFDEFVDTVVNGDSDQVVGVFVENRFSLKVVQQPVGQPAWITGNANETTEFGIVREITKNDGLIAHNYLSGDLYFSLQNGDIAQIVMGDGRIIEFEVFNIENYEALSPNSPYSDFVNLDDGKKLSASDLFYRVYGGIDTLTFQTCINRNNISTWGRIFVIGDEI